MVFKGDTLNVAVVGFGYWGGHYVRIFNELPNTRVTAVCDRREERLRLVQERFPDTAVTADVKELLEDHSFDAIVICTEAANHFSVARQAVASGKHVLVEKPMTTRVSDAEELTSSADREGVVLMVGHTFLFNNAIRKVNEYLRLDRDRIYYLHAQRTNLGPVRHDVNALWDLATHDISIFNYLMGCVPLWASAVAAKVLRNGREDIGFVTLGYPGNVLAHIHASWADPNKARELVIVCDKRRIVFNDMNVLEQVRIFEKGIWPVVKEPGGYGEYHLEVRDGDIISPKIPGGEPLKSQCAHFVECVRSGKRPLTDGQDGIGVLRVLEAIDRSVALGGAGVEVENNGYNIQAAAACAAG